MGGGRVVRFALRVAACAFVDCDGDWEEQLHIMPIIVESKGEVAPCTLLAPRVDVHLLVTTVVPVATIAVGLIEWRRLVQQPVTEG
jgi:hypothetical protein